MIKKSLLSILVLIFLATAGLYATGNEFIFSAFQRTYLAGKVTANIDDHTEFEVRTVVTGKKEPLTKHPNYNKQALSSTLTDSLNQNNAVAFITLKDGQVLNEHYFRGYTDRSKTNSFSMAKTVVSLLIGIAIEEGHIESFEQPITDFLPEFKNDSLGNKATLAQLSLMNSGYEWVEEYYTPFSPTVKLFYGNDVEHFLLNRSFSAEPGSFWEYSSASTQLLGIALIRALQKAGAAETFSEYLSEKIWKPLGMNDDALWHLDNNGMELVFCCLNTNARNFAKLGQLMLNNGRWDDKQIVPADHIQKMIQPEGQSFYGYSTWLSHDSEPAYYWFSGHLGQYIIVIPEHNMVVVKLGESRDKNQNFRTVELPKLVQEAVALTGN